MERSLFLLITCRRISVPAKFSDVLLKSSHFRAISYIFYWTIRFATSKTFSLFRFWILAKIVITGSLAWSSSSISSSSTSSRWISFVFFFESSSARTCLACDGLTLIFSGASLASGSTCKRLISREESWKARYLRMFHALGWMRVECRLLIVLYASSD